MWASFAGHALNQEQRLPHQPSLEWALPGSSWSLTRPSRDPVDQILNNLNNFPEREAYVPGPLQGTRHDVGAACAFFNGARNSNDPPESVTLRIGSRYAMRWSVKAITSSPPPSGDWMNHDYGATHYVEFSVLDGQDVIDSSIVHSAGTGLPYVCLTGGFCVIGGAWRFIAWMYDYDLVRSPFGAGTAFLTTPVSEHSLFDGPVTLTREAPDGVFGVNQLFAAGERYGPFESHVLAYPQSASALMGAAGDRLASLRPHHANFLKPANQNNTYLNQPQFAPYHRIPEIDLHGHTEFYPNNEYQSNFVFLSTSMAYALNAAASYLPPGTVSNVHHDPEVNARLSQLSFSASNLTSLGSELWQGARSIPTISCAPVPKTLNEYAGAGTNAQGPCSVLIGLTRRDAVRPLQPSSYDAVQLDTEYVVVISVASTFATMYDTVILSESEAESLFQGGSVTVDIASNAVSGTATIQATGG